MSGRIVVGVDGSAHARRALEAAIEEAKRRDASVDAVLAYSMPMPPMGFEVAAVAMPPRAEIAQGAREVLEGELARYGGDVRIERIVVEGPAARSLVEAAEGADLLVIGTRGRGGFTGLLLGSVSHYAVSHATCPVLVVPSHD